MSGHSKWSSISTRRARPTRSAASSSRSCRARSSSRPRGGPTPRQPRAPERDREGALVLDAEGQHRACDREGQWRGRRGRGLRDGRVRGLRPGRRRRARRGADGQPQPDRLRGAAPVLEARREPRERRSRRLAVRAARARARGGRGCGRGGAPARGGGRGADDVSLDGSTFEVSSAPESLSAVRRRSRRPGFEAESAELSMHREDDRRHRDESTARRCFASSKGSRRRTTSRTSTRTSTSPKRCSSR